MSPLLFGEGKEKEGGCVEGKHLLNVFRKLLSNYCKLVLELNVLNKKKTGIF